jgi:hypothetical protein
MAVVVQSRSADPVIATYVAAGVAAVLAALALMHVYWAAGGRVGADAVVPTRAAGGAPLFRPGPGATLAVAFALGAAAGLVLGRPGLAPRIGPAALYRWGPWALGAAFALRTIGEFRYVGLFKRERGTVFATRDTYVYTPLCAALAVAAFYLATA